MARALGDLAAGRPVVVVAGDEATGEGDLVLAAELATPEALAFVVRHSSGFVSVALTGSDCDRLDLPPMCHPGQDVRAAAHRVSVDARHGVSTGISAADRAATIRQLAVPGSSPTDFSRPGHVLTIKAADGGVVHRPGRAEAAVDLARLAGLRPAGMFCGLVSQRDASSMAGAGECRDFAAEHDLAVVSIGDLVSYRLRSETHVERVAETLMPTEHGLFTAVGFRSLLDGTEHLALVSGQVEEGQDVLVRVHAECLIGDVFGSMRCECSARLSAGLAAVAAAGRGVVLYMRGTETREEGLLYKLHAYQNQGQEPPIAGGPRPTVEPEDYATVAQILADLGVRSVRLLGNSGTTQAGLERHRLTITDRVELPQPGPENLRYLPTKEPASPAARVS